MCHNWYFSPLDQKNYLWWLCFDLSKLFIIRIISKPYTCVSIIILITNISMFSLNQIWKKEEMRREGQLLWLLQFKSWSTYELRFGVIIKPCLRFKVISTFAVIDITIQIPIRQSKRMEKGEKVIKAMHYNRVFHKLPSSSCFKWIRINFWWGWWGWNFVFL